MKIRRPPEAHRDSAPKGHHFFRLPRWPERDPLKLTITYRGGPQCWYEIHSRGGIVRVPGDRSIHDIMNVVYGGRPRR